MNIQATGYGMRLAPDADPADGLLDVVRVDGEHRDGLLAYASALLRGQFPELRSVQTSRVRRVEIPYVGQTFHIDGEVRPSHAAPQGSSLGTVSVECWPAALKLLLPQRAAP